MELYGKRPLASGTALVMTFPVHMTTIFSAYLAGQAFGLKMPFLYYWTVVPVLALVGAIPISPQGVGVMESFAVLLTQKQGVTVSQAIALAMSIRIGQMFWNLLGGGLFVFRGGYHAISEKEQEELEQDLPSEDERHRRHEAKTARRVRTATSPPCLRAFVPPCLLPPCLHAPFRRHTNPEKMLRRIDRLILRVPGLESAVRYYRDLLGMTLIRHDAHLASFRLGDGPAELSDPA